VFDARLRKRQFIGVEERLLSSATSCRTLSNLLEARRKPTGKTNVSKLCIYMNLFLINQLSAWDTDDIDQ